MGIDDVLSLDPDNMGLLVEMSGHNLRKSKPIDIRGVPGKSVNYDHVCVRCAECEQWTMFYSSPSYEDLKGFWQCPCCLRKVTEDRVYRSIEKENERWVNKNL